MCSGGGGEGGGGGGGGGGGVTGNPDVPGHSSNLGYSPSQGFFGPTNTDPSDAATQSLSYSYSQGISPYGKMGKQGAKDIAVEDVMGQTNISEKDARSAVTDAANSLSEITVGGIGFQAHNMIPSPVLGIASVGQAIADAAFNAGLSVEAPTTAAEDMSGIDADIDPGGVEATGFGGMGDPPPSGANNPNTTTDADLPGGSGPGPGSNPDGSGPGGGGSTPTPDDATNTVTESPAGGTPSDVNAAASHKAREDARKRALAAAGNSSTIVTGPGGLGSPPANVVRKVLLGA